MNMHGKTRSGSPFIAALLLLAAVALRASDGEDQTVTTLTFTQKGYWVSAKMDGSNPHLTFPDNPDLKIRIELKPRDDARAALMAYQPSLDKLAPTYFLRPGISTEDCAEALATARRILKGLTDASAKDAWREYPIISSLQRIFSAHGDATDAAALVALYKRSPMRDFLPEVAHIEARLGLLEQGQLKALLSESNWDIRIRAACLLRRYGSATGDRVLIEALQDPKITTESASLVPAAVLDWDSPAVLRAMRECFEQAVKKWKENQPKIAAHEPYCFDYVKVAEGVLPYLLVYGNQEDLRRLAEVKWDPEVIPQIAGIVRNPEVLLPAIAAISNYRSACELFGTAAPALWSFDPVARKRIFNRMQTLVYRKILEAVKNDRSLFEDQHAKWANIMFNIYFHPRFGFVVPCASLNTFLDELFYDKVVAQKGYDWMPLRDDFLGQIAGFALDCRSFQIAGWFYFGGYEKCIRQLDYFTTEQVAEALKGLELTPDKRDIFLAAHRTTSGCWYSSDVYKDGVERRPFWLRSAGNGLLSGILQLRPCLAEGKLSLSFDLSLNKAIFRTMIDAGPDEDFPIGQYAQNYGKKLVKGVRIFRNGKWAEIETTGPDKEGLFTATADLGSEGLKDLRVSVDLEFFGQTIAFPFDLFASVMAKKARAAKFVPTPDNEPNRGAATAEEAKRSEPAIEPSEAKNEFSFTKVLGLPLADALKILKTSSTPTDGEEVDLLGSRMFLGKNTGIVLQLSDKGKVDRVVLSLLAGGEVGQYSGPIHGGLTSASNRDQIVAKLGEPAFSTEKAEGPIEYKYPVIGYRLPNCRLNFALVREKNALAEVTFIANEPAVDKDAP